MMSIFNKLAFWKKKDDLDFDNLASKDINSGLGTQEGPIQDHVGLDEKSPFETSEPFATQPANVPPAQQPMLKPGQTGLGERDLELISSKLDTIKAILGSMDQRISNLEKAAGVDKSKERLW
tara:strand:- start:6 stop:371 length:366 start_codon:yes stop_codon:yes gene_type:complete